MSDTEDYQLPASTLAVLQQFLKEQQERDVAENASADVQEDWQLSQFWYNAETAKKLCREAISACNGSGKVACVSSPTLMKYFQEEQEVIDGKIQLKVFEFDDRFRLKYPDEFVFYDYKQPATFPPELKEYFDVVVVDPPFLSDECLVKTAQTVRLLSRPDTKIILCTGSIMEEQALKLMGAKRTSFNPQHEKNLANEFACYTNYSPITL
ncbi:unnamed protein product [Auanema sp. JU1783]|nr:unnamed protein product [Auanema sp. JU1783]